MENCLTTPAGTDQQTGIGKNAFEGRPEEDTRLCQGLIAEGLMAKGDEPHPRTTSPLPSGPRPDWHKDDLGELLLARNMGLVRRVGTTIGGYWDTADHAAFAKEFRA